MNLWTHVIFCLAPMHERTGPWWVNNKYHKSAREVCRVGIRLNSLQLCWWAVELIRIINTDLTLKCQNLIFLILRMIYKFFQHEFVRQCKRIIINWFKNKNVLFVIRFLDSRIVTLNNDELRLKAPIMLLDCYSCSI